MSAQLGANTVSRRVSALCVDAEQLDRREQVSVVFSGVMSRLTRGSLCSRAV